MSKKVPKAMIGKNQHCDLLAQALPKLHARRGSKWSVLAE
jgi:hypothetical protein